MEKSVKEIVAEIKEKMDKLGGLKHVYFVACGGSKAAIFPGLYLLQSEAKTFSATTYTSNEFVHATPKELDERCVAMTGNMQTGMAKVGQYIVTYSNGDDQVYSDSNQANALRIGFELLKQFENWENYDKAMEAYRYIDEIIEEGKKNVLADAKAWAEKYKDEPVFYVLASGSNYGVAYSMCCCHFMEMQWKHAVCLHTGEYFHGPFETTDKKLPMILLMSEGRTRALDERCLKFLRTYAENYIVIDFEKLNGGKIDKSVVEFFNPVVMIPIERYYVSQMAEVRGHSMDERRYMWKVEY